MVTQQPLPPEKIATKEFIRNLRLSFELDALETENESLKQKLLEGEALWRQERQARRETERRLKLALVESMAAMPVEFWPVAGRIARDSWREFRGA